MSDSIESKVLGVFFGYALGGFLIVASIFGFNKIPDEKQTRQYLAKVVDYKIEGRKYKSRKSYFIELENHGIFSIYRMNQDYDDFINSIKIGDNVIVRLYGPTIYEIRKGDREIYTFEEALNQDYSFSIILLIAGVVIIVLARRFFNRD